jgi:hypothetical protein
MLRPRPGYHSPVQSSTNHLKSITKSGGTLKFRISLFLLTLALAASSTAKMHASGCNNSTIRGIYALTVHGTILLPDRSTLLIHGLTKTTFDGNGNIKQLDAIATNGIVPAGWRFSTGTYSLNADCTGTMTVTNGDLPPINLQMIVSQSGNTIRDMVIDPGFVTTAEGERLQAPKK